MVPISVTRAGQLHLMWGGEKRGSSSSPGNVSRAWPEQHPEPRGRGGRLADPCDAVLDGKIPAVKVSWGGCPMTTLTGAQHIQIRPPPVLEIGVRVHSVPGWAPCIVSREGLPTC